MPQGDNKHFYFFTLQHEVRKVDTGSDLKCKEWSPYKKIPFISSQNKNHKPKTPKKLNTNPTLQYTKTPIPKFLKQPQNIKLRRKWGPTKAFPQSTIDLQITIYEIMEGYVFFLVAMGQILANAE